MELVVAVAAVAAFGYFVWTKMSKKDAPVVPGQGGGSRPNPDGQYEQEK